jgi:hypothetical protein
VWNSDKGIVLLPPPNDVSAALAAYEPAARVLRDHPASFYNYVASISSEGRIAASGEVILLGDLQLEGRSVAYTLATPFAVQGQSVEWALTGEELDKFILDVVQTPLVTRALAEFPDVTLNLYYSEVLDLPEAPMLLNYSPPDYLISLAQCGSEPSLRVPDPQHALRAFSLDGPWAFGRPEFVLDDVTPKVFSLDLRPFGDNPRGIIPFLTPPQLNTGGEPPFGRIWMQSDSFLDAGPELTLWVPRSIDPTTTEPYKSIFSALPVPVEHWADNIWVVEGMTFMVGSNGSLQAIACAGQEPR